MDEAIQEPPTLTTDETLLWAAREREDQVRRAREDLRKGHQRLTEQQIALVAEVMADVRMLSIRLGR